MIVAGEDALVAEVERRRRGGARIVLTNGAFDLLHAGHVRCLAAARALGDALVVLVNSDGSARRLKGEGRPIVPAAERAEVVDALRAVDLVHVFEDATVARLLARLRPEVYAKGTDYALETLPEAEAARAAGAEIAFVGDPKTRSSTPLIERAGAWWASRRPKER